jgi:hypothetical protein
MAYLLDVVLGLLRDLWHVLRHGDVPKERLGCYVAGVTGLAWTATATVVWLAGLFAMTAALGSPKDAHPAVVALWWLSWPAIAIGGTVWAAYRRGRR